MVEKVLDPYIHNISKYLANFDFLFSGQVQWCHIEKKNGKRKKARERESDKDEKEIRLK